MAKPDKRSYSCGSGPDWSFKAPRKALALYQYASAQKLSCEMTRIVSGQVGINQGFVWV